jgi:hypothetical protein
MTASAARSIDAATVACLQQCFNKKSSFRRATVLRVILHTARLGDAVRIAGEDLLIDLVPREEVAALAADLYRGLIPYSTNDLAVSVALNFF